ncbi:hypothetical protein GCM10010276_34680 [Streptomyces longisporus]|uniref:Transposase n=1 Tax=Streptomyces longisporus TaxID=1948 RepID=A0ABP5Z6S2_STRLO
MPERTARRHWERVTRGSAGLREMASLLIKAAFLRGSSGTGGGACHEVMTRVTNPESGRETFHGIVGPWRQLVKGFGSEISART